MNTDREERPWGWWKVAHLAPFSQTVKMLCVNPGQMLSLQVHQSRTEFWVPLSDGLMAYTRNDVGTPSGRLLRANEVYKVPAKYAHRLVNPTEREIMVVEIINGRYDEGDITRLHDNYNRED